MCVAEAETKKAAAKGNEGALKIHHLKRSSLNKKEETTTKIQTDFSEKLKKAQGKEPASRPRENLLKK